jgi:thiol:disulfide interchange protein DsbD
VFVDGNGNIIKNAGGYVNDINRFIKILDDVKAAYKP